MRVKMSAELCFYSPTFWTPVLIDHQNNLRYISKKFSPFRILTAEVAHQNIIRIAELDLNKIRRQAGRSDTNVSKGVRRAKAHFPVDANGFRSQAVIDYMLETTEITAQLLEQ